MASHRGVALSGSITSRHGARIRRPPLRTLFRPHPHTRRPSMASPHRQPTLHPREHSHAIQLEARAYAPRFNTILGHAISADATRFVGLTHRARNCWHNLVLPSTLQARLDCIERPPQPMGVGCFRPTHPPQDGHQRTPAPLLPVQPTRDAASRSSHPHGLPP